MCDTQAKGEFDYVSTMEDLTQGQRIGNYSIDFQRKGSQQWETLVPPVQPVVSACPQRPFRQYMTYQISCRPCSDYRRGALAYTI